MRLANLAALFVTCPYSYDDLVDFTFVGGNVALDFAGTVQHRRSDPVEMLKSPEDLSAWTVAAGLVDAPPPVDPAALSEAVELREAIYRLACAARDRANYDAADRELLNQMAAYAPADVRLGADGTVERTGDIRAALASVAREAIELLGGPLAQAIRECGAEQCTRLYVDSSRARSRRWCDMRWCGNRAKAAAFRARHSAARAPR